MTFRFRVAFAAALLSPLAIVALAAPACAAVDQSDPARFVATLSDTGFGVLRGGDRQGARVQFRQLLAQYFAVDAIGDRLIRRWIPQITPAQRTAYKAAFPNFIIGTYADRLFDYAHADLKVVRSVPAGTGATVYTVVTKPGGAQFNAVWSITRGGTGYQVTNLTVAGINLALTQAADFDSVVQRQGFDALVTMMKKRG